MLFRSSAPYRTLPWCIVNELHNVSHQVKDSMLPLDRAALSLDAMHRLCLGQLLQEQLVSDFVCLAHGSITCLQSITCTSLTHHRYGTVQSKIPDMKAAGITHVWLPPPSQSVSPQVRSSTQQLTSSTIASGAILAHLLGSPLLVAKRLYSDHNLARAVLPTVHAAPTNACLGPHNEGLHAWPVSAKACGVKRRYAGPRCLW